MSPLVVVLVDERRLLRVLGRQRIERQVVPSVGTDSCAGPQFLMMMRLRWCFVVSSFTFASNSMAR
jgi:hypothetical protein